MNKLIVDADMRSRLPDLDKSFSVCDQRGRMLGQYMPSRQFERMTYSWPGSRITVEELDRTRRQRGGRSLQEILESLRQASLDR